MWYLVLLIPATQELMYPGCVYVGCYTRAVIFGQPAWGLLSGEMKCKRRPVGTRGLKAKFEILSKSTIFRVLCNIRFDVLIIRHKEHIFF